MRNLTNLGNANSEAKTPVETPRGKTPVQNPKGTSRATPLSAKRKAADLEPEPRQAKQLKTSGEIATQDNSKKSKLQELLGGSSAKEQNFKYDAYLRELRRNYNRKLDAHSVTST